MAVLFSFYSLVLTRAVRICDNFPSSSRVTCLNFTDDIILSFKSPPWFMDKSSLVWATAWRQDPIEMSWLESVDMPICGMQQTKTFELYTFRFLRAINIKFTDNLLTFPIMIFFFNHCFKLSWICLLKLGFEFETVRCGARFYIDGKSPSITLHQCLMTNALVTNQCIGYKALL